MLARALADPQAAAPRQPLASCRPLSFPPLALRPLPRAALADLHYVASLSLESDVARRVFLDTLTCGKTIQLHATWSWIIMVLRTRYFTVLLQLLVRY